MFGKLRWENLALRQQLAVFKRRCPRPRLRKADRLFWLCLSRTWKDWHRPLIIVRPETVVSWHRKGLPALLDLDLRRAHLGYAYARMGGRCRAREVLDQLSERSRTEYVSPYHFALIYTGLGERELRHRWSSPMLPVPRPPRRNFASAIGPLRVVAGGTLKSRAGALSCRVPFLETARSPT